MKQYLKYICLFVTGGLLYNIVELVYRGWTHWTMFFLGGICFICLGLINEVISWKMPLWQQVLTGACIITGLEFVTGCIVNLGLGWDVWDYSSVPGNIMGQICLQYFFLWMPVSLTGIVLDDCLRFWMFGEEKPHYNVGLTRNSSKIIWFPV